MRPDFSRDWRSTKIIALAVVIGIISSQIVLVLTAGSLGIPGLFAIHLDAKKAGEQAPGAAASKGISFARRAPPPIATPAPKDDEPISSPAPFAQPAEEGNASAPPAAPGPEQSNAAGFESARPSTGPIGWLGPEGPPGGASDSDEDAVLEGPIQLDLGDALSDFNREETAEETDGGGDAAAPAKPSAPAAQPAPPPPSDGDQREVLPWDAIVPDAELMAPVDVPEETPEFSLPGSAVVKGWLQGRTSNAATGAYRYEMWLEPPTDMRLRLNAVGYQFKPPSGEPVTKMSRRAESGFRVFFDSSGCQGEVILTLTYRDGRSQKVPVEGCSAVN